MDFYWKARVWKEQYDCPNTCKVAKPVNLVTVKNKRVITVTNAKYRDAVFSGTFLLSDDFHLPAGKTGFARVEILCKWFKHRLKTRGLAITVNLKDSKIANVASAEVYTDFSK
jgi:hypothetical protein